MNIESYIRTIPDFPQPGVTFRDFTPLLAHGPAFKALVDQLSARYAEKSIDVVVGIEARGFVLASALAYALGAGTVLIRKAGKLPHQTHAQEYELEYGSSVLEISCDALQAGQRVLVVDDVLATGGTVGAAIKLLQEHFSLALEELVFLIELDDLKGREKLSGLSVHSVFHY
ncbi:adenine phosphoribosyltransferase [Coraliomargarita sp. SDUM461004]|uniref:Adenine phosphoribosyltransferase n=1 Tax=Thalassobacterium sedimentorum TaxID=3041258 RepID=A0ABU1AKK3_9BACT|nr:adenine phosphoribosyltransferase [Coraliomargarita sp. SDUM461004]MDQ8195342.1 adenine phosphoribosyltransferase [Coraliomargarita sp. SDUM461004]